VGKSLDQRKLRESTVQIKGTFYVFDRHSAKALLELLVSNAFVTVGGKTYHQKKGLPMGSNPAVHLANDNLFAYEVDWVLHLLTWATYRPPPLQTPPPQPFSFLHNFPLAPTPNNHLWVEMRILWSTLPPPNPTQTSLFLWPSPQRLSLDPSPLPLVPDERQMIPLFRRMAVFQMDATLRYVDDLLSFNNPLLHRLAVCRPGNTAPPIVLYPYNLESYQSQTA
jgi:hypothetical protein